MLQRTLLEWGMLLAAGLSLALLALWAASIASDQVRAYTHVPNVLNLPNGPDARDDPHFIVADGTFCFCKRAETLDEAVKRLKSLRITA